MAWIELEVGTLDQFPGDESPVGEIIMEEKPMPFNTQIKASGAIQGFDIGTIINPSYGNGVIIPVSGDVQFERPISGAIKPRPEFGIVYPVP